MRFSSALLVSLVLACGNQDKADRALSDYRGFRDRMCACTTNECRSDVRAELAAWDKTEAGQLLFKTPKGQISETQVKQIDPIEAAIKKCGHGRDDG